MIAYIMAFGCVLLLISYFIKGVLIHLALLGLWIWLIISAGSSLPAGTDRTWLQIVAAVLMMYSVIMVIKRFLPSGVD